MSLSDTIVVAETGIGIDNISFDFLRRSDVKCCLNRSNVSNTLSSNNYFVVWGQCCSTEMWYISLVMGNLQHSGVQCVLAIRLADVDRCTFGMIRSELRPSGPGLSRHRLVTRSINNPIQKCYLHSSIQTGPEMAKFAQAHRQLEWILGERGSNDTTEIHKIHDSLKCASFNVVFTLHPNQI